MGRAVECYGLIRIAVGNLYAIELDVAHGHRCAIHCQLEVLKYKVGGAVTQVFHGHCSLFRLCALAVDGDYQTVGVGACADHSSGRIREVDSVGMVIGLILTDVVSLYGDGKSAVVIVRGLLNLGSGSSSRKGVSQQGSVILLLNGCLAIGERDFLAVICGRSQLAKVNHLYVVYIEIVIGTTTSGSLVGGECSQYQSWCGAAVISECAVSIVIKGKGILCPFAVVRGNRLLCMGDNDAHILNIVRGVVHDCPFLVEINADTGIASVVSGGNKLQPHLHVIRTTSERSEELSVVSISVCIADVGRVGEIVVTAAVSGCNGATIHLSVRHHTVGDNSKYGC